MIRLSIHEQPTYTLLFVDATKSTKPIELQKINYPQLDGTKGLVVVGYSTWIMGAVFYNYRNRTQWVGGYDPILKGAVVIVSLTADRVVGELIEMALPCLKCAELGIEKKIKVGAKYPYCDDHRGVALHRS